MNRIENYVNSLIPEKIPDIKKIKIRDEFLSHIYDQIDFYMEIGYSIDQSIEKALENMGNDEETKGAIKKQLTELHFERNWWGIVTFFVMLLLNWCSFYLGAWVFSVDSNYPEEKGLIYSFFAVFTVILAMIVFYRLGMRKCLMSLGFANLSVSIIFFWAFYPQAALYSLLEFVCYLLDKYTPIAFGKGDEIPVIGVIILTFAFLIAVTVACFALSKKIKKRGKPEKKGKIGVIIFSVIFAVTGVFSTVFYDTAEIYFGSIPYWITYDAKIEPYPKAVFNFLDIGMEYSQAEKILEKYEFKTVEDYSESIMDKNIRETFDAQFDSYEYFFDDYEIWLFTRASNLEISVYTLYTKKGADGTLIGKGVGDGNYEALGYFPEKFNDYSDISALADNFNNLSKGADKEQVMELFSGNVLCAEFTEKTPDGIKAYYRISSYGQDNREVLPCNYEDGYHTQIVNLEFTFLNNKLMEGKLNFTADFIKSHTLTVDK